MRSLLKGPNVLFCFLLIGCTILVSASSAMAQGKAGEKPKLRIVDLKTKDGIKLKAFYFPSDQGEKAIPVMVVHEWGGQGSPYGPLVAALHKAGCAVLVPDYRGHGKSDRKAVDGRGRERELVPTQMNKGDVEAIVAYDLETCKAFLKEENNAKRLNLNALVLIGVREGCVMATKWAERDWNFPSVGSVKQGQDVKALIYISPDRLIKGVSLDSLFRSQPLMYQPIMIVAGKSSPQASEAQRLSKRIETTKRKFGRGKVTGFKTELPATPLSGAAFVQSVKSVIPSIITFIKEEIVVSGDVNPWIERR